MKNRLNDSLSIAKNLVKWRYDIGTDIKYCKNLSTLKHSKYIYQWSPPALTTIHGKLKPSFQ